MLRVSCKRHFFHLACVILFISTFLDEVPGESVSERFAHEANDEPIIGVLTQDYLGKYKDYKGSKSFIAATYIKFIQSAGGRVVPIFVNRQPRYYENLLKQLNGVLLPGGDQELETSSFTAASRIIRQLAIQWNKQGKYFPIWGTCQGLEVLSYLQFNRSFLTTSVSMEDTPARIEFLFDYATTRRVGRIFKQLPQSLYKDMSGNKIAIHYHQWCLSMKNFTQFNFNSSYRALAVATDTNGTECVSILESKEYPIYATQFHPEFLFTFKKDSPGFQNIVHTRQAVQMAQYFANFFVNEARKNSNKFTNLLNQQSKLIYAYEPEYITSTIEPYDQIYFFPLH